MTRCSRCKKPIPENCKTVDDDTKFGKTVKGEFSKLNAERLREANKDVLRNIRIQHKGRKKQNQDEPECIALSSDEDGDDEDEETESRTGDEEFDTGNLGSILFEVMVDTRVCYLFSPFYVIYIFRRW